MIYNDDILREVRAAREAYGQRFNFDLDAIVADLQQQNEQGDWPVVRREPRSVPGWEPAPGGTTDKVGPGHE